MGLELQKTLQIPGTPCSLSDAEGWRAPDFPPPWANRQDKTRGKNYHLLGGEGGGQQTGNYGAHHQIDNVASGQTAYPRESLHWADEPTYTPSTKRMVKGTIISMHNPDTGGVGQWQGMHRTTREQRYEEKTNLTDERQNKHWIIPQRVEVHDNQQLAPSGGDDWPEQQETVVMGSIPHYIQTVEFQEQQPTTPWSSYSRPAHQPRHNWHQERPPRASRITSPPKEETTKDATNYQGDTDLIRTVTDIVQRLQERNPGQRQTDTLESRGTGAGRTYETQMSHPDHGGNAPIYKPPRQTEQNKIGGRWG